jgi:hypothetical protein
MPDTTTPSALSSHRTLWLAGTVIAVLVAAGLLVVGPGETSVCLIRTMTGVACPGCGMTRAAAALLRGDVPMAWSLHPLAPLVALQAVVIWILWGWTVLVRRSRVDEAILLWLFLGNFALLVLVWIVRFATRTLPA